MTHKILKNDLIDENNVCFLTGRNSHFMNGGEGQVDMLDIPGKGRCCVYIARFSYDPPE